MRLGGTNALLPSTGMPNTAGCCCCTVCTPVWWVFVQRLLQLSGRYCCVVGIYCIIFFAVRSVLLRSVPPYGTIDTASRSVPRSGLSSRLVSVTLCFASSPYIRLCTLKASLSHQHGSARKHGASWLSNSVARALTFLWHSQRTLYSSFYFFCIPPLGS